MRTRRFRRGMTLIEVLVAITVVLVIAMIVAQSLANAILFNDILGDRDALTRQARVAMSKIRRDIQLAFLTPHQQVVDNFETVFVGIDEDPDKVFFASLAHQRIYRDSRECDQTEITIWAEQAPRELGDGHILYHREAPRIDGEPDEGGVVYPLAYNVRSFNLRYLDAQRQEYVDEWDTRTAETPYRLPRAVEVALVLITPDPDDAKRTLDVPFLTTVMLHYGERIPSPNNPFGAAPPLAGMPGNQMFAGGAAGASAVAPGRAPSARPRPMSDQGKANLGTIGIRGL